MKRPIAPSRPSPTATPITPNRSYEAAGRRRGVATAVGSDGADRLLRRPGRHRRTARSCRAARRRHAARPARVRRRHERSAALGYRSIGDASTGFEHYINTDLINDDKFLDPTAPESLVYEVDGDARTLVSAMFIARRDADRRPRAHRLRRAADAVARARQPVLGPRRQRARRSSGACSRTSAARARPAPSTPAARTRWCTCGSRPTSAARSPPSRVTVPARPA